MCCARCAWFCCNLCRMQGHFPFNARLYVNIWLWWMAVLLHTILEGSQLWLCAQLWLKQSRLLNWLWKVKNMRALLFNMQCRQQQETTINSTYVWVDINLTTGLQLHLLLEMTLRTRLWSMWQSRFVFFKSVYSRRSSWSRISRQTRALLISRLSSQLDLSSHSLAIMLWGLSTSSSNVSR